MPESVIHSCQITPNSNGPTNINPLHKVLHRIITKEMCYGITITFSPNKKVKHGEALWRMTPKDQYLYSSKYIREKFHEFSFILFEEYTQKGIIHWHGIIWHPLYKLKNSMLMVQLKRALRRCGKANVDRNNLAPVSDADAWVTYMTKERGRFTAWQSEPYIKSDDVRIFTNKYFYKDLLFHIDRTTQNYRMRNNICSFLEG